ncbi:uncharacterized protein LOC142337047 [Convolutriloba macropyga]|uniref:uncharacterized protein LOC142337047 n=1 Tax=Convolutriloba macropyga TaxID=536237 RepID=UPI003F51DA06
MLSKNSSRTWRSTLCLLFIVYMIASASADNKKKKTKPAQKPKDDRSHFKECTKDEDCPDARFHCMREKMFDVEPKSRCFPKRCEKVEDCPVPMICKLDKNQCDFDIPEDLLQKLEL